MKKKTIIIKSKFLIKKEGINAMCEWKKALKKKCLLYMQDG